MFRRSLAVISLSLLAACGDSGSPTSPPAAGPVGTWRLSSIGGAALPVDLGAGYIYYSDEYTLNSDNTFSDVSKQRYAERGDTTVRYSGTWALTNGKIEFTQSGSGRKWSLSYGGDSLVDVPPSGKAFVYRR